MQETANETCKQIELIFELEENRPFTQNREAFMAFKEEHMTDFHYAHTNWQLPEQSLRASFSIWDKKGARRSVSHDYLSENSLLNQVMSDLTSKGIQVTNPKRFALLQPHSEYGTEIAFMSACLAYFDIASMRVIEAIPKIFEVVYLKRFEGNLRARLTFELKLNNMEGVETCKRYTRENIEIQKKRQILIDKQKALGKALDMLRSLHE